MAGFLPPIDSTGYNIGWVDFTVEPLPGLPTGTEITNQAFVNFDSVGGYNPAPKEGPYLNTIDADPPASYVIPFPSATGNPGTVVEWTGSDPGSGIATYQVYMADSVEEQPGNEFALWETTPDAFAVLDSVELDHIYSFYSIAIDHVGNREPKSPTVEAQIRIVATDVGEIADDLLPKTFALSQNYPNPFNPNTKIEYALPVNCHVKLTIYNILGQKVRTLIDKDQAVGCHSVFWDSKNSGGKEVASGIYLYRLQTNDFVDTKKMILLK